MEIKVVVKRKDLESGRFAVLQRALIVLTRRLQELGRMPLQITSKWTLNHFVIQAHC